MFDAEDLIDKPIGTLSGGQLQRVLLSMAIYDEPKLIILDEPVSGIDSSGMRLFYEKMKFLKENYDMAILIVSHDLEYVYKYADNVLLLDKSVIAAGSPHEVYKTKSFDDTFGGFKFDDIGVISDSGIDDSMKKESKSIVKEEPFDASYKGGKHE